MSTRNKRKRSQIVGDSEDGDESDEGKESEKEGVAEEGCGGGEEGGDEQGDGESGDARGINIPLRLQPNNDDQPESENDEARSSLVSSVLHEFSAGIAPIHGGVVLGMPPLINADNFMASTILDYGPGIKQGPYKGSMNGDKIFCKVAGPHDTVTDRPDVYPGERIEECIFDGFVIKLLELWKPLFDRAKASLPDGYDTDAMQRDMTIAIRKFDLYGSTRWDEWRDEWLDTMTRLSVYVHMPLMELQPDIPEDFCPGLRNIMAPYTTPDGKLIAFGRVYRRRNDQMSLAMKSEIILCYDNKFQFHLKYMGHDANKPDKSFILVTNQVEPDNRPMVEVARDTVPATEWRPLLVWSEMQTMELERVRRDFAKEYVTASDTLLLAAACHRGEKQRAIHVAYIAARTGGTVCCDVPRDGESPQPWMWNQDQLWHEVHQSNEGVSSGLDTLVKSELMTMAHKSKWVQSEWSEEYRSKSEDTRGDLVGSHMHKAYTKADKCFGLSDVIKLKDKAKKTKETDDGGSDGSDGSDGDERGEARKTRFITAAMHLLGCSDEHARRVHTNARKLREFCYQLLGWTIRPDFGAAVNASRQVGFRNGIQDFTPPYAFHPPTPLDLVSKRLPYDLPEHSEHSEHRATEDEEYVLSIYMMMFFDKDVALREMDKDAVTFLGECARMGDANIRVHLGPYDEENKAWGSRCGKTLRLTLMGRIFGHMFDKSKPGGMLGLVMVPGKAYSMFSGIEKTRTMWVDEAQDNKDKGGNGPTGRDDDVQTWNPGLVLRLCPASDNPTFTYRSEYGCEKTVRLNLQNLNVVSNRVRVPANNPGFKTKTEVSPYPQLGFDTQEKVDASVNAGKPAFLIDPKRLDFIKHEMDRGVIARYFVDRAIAIHQDPTGAPYPKTQKHIDATNHLFEVSREPDAKLESDVANDKLRRFLGDSLCPCEGVVTGDLKQSIVDINKPGATRRCFCDRGRMSGRACHFTIRKLTDHLKKHDSGLYHHFTTGNHTRPLEKEVRTWVGIDMPNKQTQFNKYDRGAIFGYTIHIEPETLPQHGDADEAAEHG